MPHSTQGLPGSAVGATDGSAGRIMSAMTGYRDTGKGWVAHSAPIAMRLVRDTRRGALNSAAFRLCVVGSLVALSACTTPSSGMGGGDLSTRAKDEEPVLFSWQSTDGGLSGTLLATLPTRTFTGPFMEITLRTPRETLSPFWSGWDEGWGDWPYGVVGWDSVSAMQEFTRYYSGKVIANLHDARGQGMRCRFDLRDALRGMRSGAHGQCQFAGGKILNATIDQR